MKKSVPYEAAEQRALVAKLRKCGLFVYHIPNHKEQKDGALAGIPDLQIVVDGGLVVWVELKRRKGGSVSPEQKKIHASLKELGHTVILAKGAKEAWEALIQLPVLGLSSCC